MKEERDYSKIIDDLLNKRELPQNESGYQTIWNSAENFEYPKHDVNAKWNQFKEKLNKETTPLVLKVSYLRRWAVAVSIALIIAGGLLVFNNLNKSNPIEYVTNQIQNIDLQDGSHIVLNKGSKINTDSKFAEKHRDLTLDGEAFFDVNKNTKLPFTIKTGNLKTVVTGTKFNIDAYSKEITNVSLVEGSVKLFYNDKEVLTLNPGEIATVNQQTGEILVTVDKQIQTLSWKENKLVFENEELKNVIDRIENVLGVKFEYPKELSHTKISTTISKLDQELAVKILSETLETEVRISE